MQSPDVARILDEMGTLLEIRGENPFRCRAYHTAAHAVRGLDRDLAEMVADGTLAEVPGIGETMVEKITRLVTTGRLEAYDDLKKAIPPGLPSLMRVPGLGPKKVQELYKSLGISTLDALKKAAESGKLTGMKGYGEKTIAKILEGIAFVESTGERILQISARRLAEPLLAALRDMKGVERAEIAGSLRRRSDTIGDLDLVFASAHPQSVLKAFSGLPDIDTILASGPTKLSVRLKDGVQCDVRGVTNAQFAFALNYFTGSKDHNIALRRRAQQRGLKLSEYALEGEGPKGAIACDDEAELYQALDLDYIAPELRQAAGEIEAAEKHTLPELITTSDLKGTFHCHSDWSDGGNSLEEMVDAAIAAGLSYLGFADHSRSAAYAGGLSIERVRQQWDVLDGLGRKYGKKIHIFKGIESDILPDGSLDYPAEILAGFDYVVGSVHSGFQMTLQEMTARICRALANPYLTMLGHPTGRLLLTRAGYPLDLVAVIETAARHGKLIEINANPHRLDLDSEHCRRAKQQGVTLVINPDAHATGELGYLDYGVGVARRGWLAAGDVLNTRTSSRVSADLERRRDRAAE
jgi:DNA polymerase (family 10)